MVASYATVDCVVKETQKAGRALIFEFEFLESDNPAHPIGSKGTWFLKWASLQDIQIGSSNVLELLAAILGFDITNLTHLNQVKEQVQPQLEGLLTVLMDSQTTAALGGRETVAVECRLTPTRAGRDFTRHTWSPWAPVPGWTPAPTPAVAQMPQRSAAQPAASPQGHPAAYAPPAYSPPALAPQAPPVYAPPPQQAAPVYVPAQPAPYGQPAMPPPGVLPAWMTPPK